MDRLSALGTWGNNLQYNCLTFAENQHEQIPSGWSSFHVEKGFKKKDNVISIWSGRGFRQRVGHDIPSLTLKTNDEDIVKRFYSPSQSWQRGSFFYSGWRFRIKKNGGY